MNYNLTYNPETYPANQATDSNYLFNTLGYFWQKVFIDKDTQSKIQIDGKYV